MTYRLRNLGLAIALAAVAVLLVFYYVSQERGRLQEDQELVPVWVAAKDIPAGTSGAELVAGGFITQSDVERAQVTPGALLEPDDVTTKIVSDPIYKGEQVSQLRFRSEAERGIRAQLTGNLRAVQLPGDEHQLLAGTLQTGDRVDVVGTWNVPESDTNHVSRVLLRDILVLEAAQKADVGSKITEEGGKALSVKLALTDAQEQKLFWVASNGGWTLVLRPPKDASDSPESSESWWTLLNDGLREQQLAELFPAGANDE
ncbi:MAG TPA: Flp pilus assembly protein CpaB [Gaiellaceae bacterium]|jgi:Flp pilus assembly protein CpaB|nr:Flp pilus assembly protein CpaB [Gaiellaceae bacterium]